jgi:hypothetical protein
MELLSWHKLQFYLLNAVVSLVWRAVFFFQLFILLAGLTLGVLREYRSFPESNFSYFQEGRTSQLEPKWFWVESSSRYRHNKALSTKEVD